VVVTGAGERDHVLGVLGRDIAPNRVQVETRARNAYENAVRSKATARPSSGERWVLCTHAARDRNVPRQGFAVDPWPVYDLDAYQPINVRGPPRMVGPCRILAAWLYEQFAALLDP
jgi:hypothetical protein